LGRNTDQEKTSRWGWIFLGATEQNLLKLFERIIDDPALGVPVLTQLQPIGETIIY
jgi:hypothetical protein